VRGRRLFREIKARGYTGSFLNLERLLAKWRNPKRKVARPAPPALRAQTVDPPTGRLVSPIVGGGAVRRGLMHSNYHLARFTSFSLVICLPFDRLTMPT